MTRTQCDALDLKDLGTRWKRVEAEMEEGVESIGASGTERRECSCMCREADANTETNICMRMWRRDSE